MQTHSSMEYQNQTSIIFSLHCSQAPPTSAPVLKYRGDVMTWCPEGDYFVIERAWSITYLHVLLLTDLAGCTSPNRVALSTAAEAVDWIAPVIWKTVTVSGAIHIQSERVGWTN